MEQSKASALHEPANVEVRTAAKIPIETAELLRIDLTFEHTLPTARKIELSHKYGLDQKQVEEFFKYDMKDQRNEEKQKMSKNQGLNAVVFDSFEKVQAAKKKMGFSWSDVVVMPPKNQQKTLMAEAMASTSEEPTGLAPSTSSSSKKKISKANAKNILRFEFQQNSKLPASRKLELAQRLGIPPDDVRKFFVTERAKNIRGWVRQTTRHLPKFKF